jgi:uncharacterized delta-60 repeat protein
MRLSLWFRLLISVLTLKMIYAAAPSVVGDYHLGLEGIHGGRFIPMENGDVLAVNVEWIDGEPMGGMVRLGGDGEVIATFQDSEMNNSSSQYALSLPGGRTLTHQSLTHLLPLVTIWKPDGTRDLTFQSPFGQNSSVAGVAQADDGKFFVWGSFFLEDQRRNLAKLMPDGSVDPDFPVDFSGTIRSIIRDGDSHFLISGILETTGSNYASIHRVSLNGDLDPFFNAGHLSGQVLSVFRTANDDLLFHQGSGLGRLIGNGFPDPDGVLPVTDVLPARLQKSIDGSFYITGGFTEIAGVPRDGVAKLTPEGDFDPSFEIPGQVDLRILSDGNLLVWSDFTSYQGELRYGVALLNASGNLLPGFQQRLASEGDIYSFDQFSDDSILVHGNFRWLVSEGEVRFQQNIAKLTPEGLPDESFLESFAGRNGVMAKVLQDDGILVGFDGGNGNWERLESNGASGPALPLGFEEINASSVMKVSHLNDGSFSIFTRLGNSDSRHVLLSDGRVTFSEKFPSPRDISTLPNGTSYLLNGFSRSSLNVISRDGIFIPQRAFALPPIGNSQARGEGFEILPGLNFLVNGSLTSERLPLIQIDSDGEIAPSFVGRPVTGGGISRSWAIPERGEYFISGGFTSYDGVDCRGLAQVRSDGSIEPGFDLGTGLSGGVWALTPLPSGDILVGGASLPLSIDGQRFPAIAKLRPAPQVVPSIPDPPFDVSVAATSPLTTGLAWTSSPGTQGILIERKPPGGSWSLVAKLDTETGSYEDLAKKGTVYEYRIIAFNSTGESSTQVEVATPGDVIIGGSVSGGSVELLENARVDTVHRLRNGKYLVAGSISLAGDVAVHEGTHPVILRLNADGSYDSTFTPFKPTQRAVRTLEEQVDGKILVGTGSSSSAVISAALLRINADGTLDPDFPDLAFPNDVNVIQILEDGKILVAGRFRNFDLPDDGFDPASSLVILNPNGSVASIPSGILGSVDTVARTSTGGFLLAGDIGTNHDIVRLNPDGSYDDSFVLAGILEGRSGEIRGIHEFPSGKILAGGEFEGWRPEDSPSTVDLQNVIVINPDGSIDPVLTQALGEGIDQEIEGIGSFPSGKAMVVGDFSIFGGVPRSHLALIDQNGILDSATFDISGDPFLRAVETMRNGEVFPVGAYGAIGGIWRGGVTRFNDDPIRADAGFQASLAFSEAGRTGGRALVTNSDGGLFIGGRFDLVRKGTTVHECSNLCFIQPDGEINFSFAPQEIYGEVHSFDLDSKGDLVVGGSFATTNQNSPRTNLAKVKPDGSLDENFAQLGTPNYAVNDVMIDDADRIYIAGRFDGIGIKVAQRLARLDNDGEFDPTFGNAPGFAYPLFNAMDFHNGQLFVASDEGPLDIRNLDGSRVYEMSPPFARRGIGVRSFGPLGVAVAGSLAEPQNQITSSVTMLPSDLSAEAIWETLFEGDSQVYGYSREEGSFYVAGDLTLGGRETSVVAFDPVAGLKLNFEAAPTDFPALAVERVGDRIAVTGEFTRWGEDANRGFAWLNSEVATLPLEQATFTELSASSGYTLLRWEPSLFAFAYRIEARESGGEKWRIVGYRDNLNGIFLLSEGTNSAGREYRLVAIDRSGSESIPSVAQSVTAISFDLWKRSHGLENGYSADSDFDGDGIPLLVEYTLDLDPAAPSKIPEPEVLNGVVTYRIASLRPDVECLIQVSDDLGKWTDYGKTPGELATQNALQVSHPLNGTSGRYYRVHCELR